MRFIALFLLSMFALVGCTTPAQRFERSLSKALSEAKADPAHSQMVFGDSTYDITRTQSTIRPLKAVVVIEATGLEQDFFVTKDKFQYTFTYFYNGGWYMDNSTKLILEGTLKGHEGVQCFDFVDHFKF